MSDFVISKKAQAALIVKVETKAQNRQKWQEQQRLEREAAAAREAAEQLAAEQYTKDCKVVNAIRRKGGATIAITFPCKIHVPTFNAALQKLGLDSCELLAYGSPTQRHKAAKIWANQLADALHLAYPKANMKRKHPLFIGVQS